MILISLGTNSYAGFGRSRAGDGCFFATGRMSVCDIVVLGGLVPDQRLSQEAIHAIVFCVMAALSVVFLRVRSRAVLIGAGKPPSHKIIRRKEKE